MHPQQLKAALKSVKISSLDLNCNLVNQKGLFVPGNTPRGGYFIYRMRRKSADCSLGLCVRAGHITESMLRTASMLW